MLLLRRTKSVRTEPYRLIRSGVRDLQELHEHLPLARKALIKTHPSDSLVLIWREVNSGKELSQEICIKVFVEGDDVADAKLLHQGKSITEIVLMGLHVPQTD